MQARYYDPVIGRFLSTDPIGYQDQLNLYAYCHNDSINCTDPNGELGLLGGLIGGAVGAAAGVLTTAITNPDFTKGDLLKSAAKGFVAGGVIGATGCVACGAAAAGLAGAADGALTARADGGNVLAGAAKQAAVDYTSTLVGGGAGKAFAGPAGEAVSAVTSSLTAATAEAYVNAAPGVVDAVTNKVNQFIEAAAPGLSGAVDAIENTGSEMVPDHFEEESR